jgi:hypothetical protein
MLSRAKDQLSEQSGVKRLDPEARQAVAEPADEPFELGSVALAAESATPPPALMSDTSYLDDEFADEQTPVMGVRVVFGGDGQVESVVPFQSETPPPSNIEGLSGSTILPPPLDEEDWESAIPLTRRRTGLSSVPPVYVPHAEKLQSPSRFGRWAAPLASALVASLLTVAGMKWFGSLAQPASPDTGAVGAVQPPLPAFDLPVVEAALSEASDRAAACLTESDSRGVRVAVKVSPAGTVAGTEFVGDGPADPQSGACIVRELESARVPAYAGADTTIVKTVSVRPAP